MSLIQDGQRRPLSRAITSVGSTVGSEGLIPLINSNSVSFHRIVQDNIQVKEQLQLNYSSPVLDSFSIGDLTLVVTKSVVTLVDTKKSSTVFELETPIETFDYWNCSTNYKVIRDILEGITSQSSTDVHLLLLKNSSSITLLDLVSLKVTHELQLQIKDAIIVKDSHILARTSSQLYLLNLNTSFKHFIHINLKPSKIFSPTIHMVSVNDEHFIVKVNDQVYIFHFANNKVDLLHKLKTIPSTKLLVWFTHLFILNNSTIQCYDIFNGSLVQEIGASYFISATLYKNTLILFSKESSLSFHLKSPDSQLQEALSQLNHHNEHSLQTAINLILNSSIDASFQSKFESLQKLTTCQGLIQLDRDIPSVISKFIGFFVSPLIVIPAVLSKDNPKSLEYLIPYLTDIHRKLTFLERAGQLNLDSDIVLTTDNFLSIEDEDIQSFLPPEAPTSVKNVQELLTLVDDTLVDAYLATNNMYLLESFLRRPNHCTIEKVEKRLAGNTDTLVEFYFNKGSHAKSIALIHNNKERLIRYLTKLGNNELSTILQCFTDYLSDDDFPKVFMVDSTQCDSYDFFRVLDLLKSSKPQLVTKYLEYLIGMKNLKPRDLEKLHTILISNYILELNEENFQKIYEFVAANKFYNPSTIVLEIKSRLDKKPSYQLSKLETLPLAKLQEHEKVVDILISIKEPEEAVEYVLKLHGHQNLVLKLLRIFLEQDSQTLLLQLLNSTSGDTSLFLDVLQLLPDEFPIQELNRFISTQLVNLTNKAEDTTLKMNLLTSLKNKSEYTLWHDVLTKHVAVSRETKCIVCHKNIKFSVVNYYVQNKDLIHYGCSKQYEKNLSHLNSI
ncbi:BA75_01556T0 [Komagataella pastoris]|uniref:BA75_01556T0 n=1 Tax=Komagataella pastoris TaxID=4922 RepID=A0A1B2J584_PICPA|nr:BA75_01556T0 [Komagataella pastoris]